MTDRLLRDKIENVRTLLTLMVMWAAGSANAQVPQDLDEELLSQARSLYERGVQAAADGDFESAREALGRSYEIVPHHRTLFNRAAAEREGGWLLEAALSYTEYLAHPEAEHTEEAEAALQEVRVSTPRLVLDFVFQSDDRLLVNGILISHAEVQHDGLPLNPGPAHIELQREGQTVASTEISLLRGEVSRTTLEVSQEPPPEEDVNDAQDLLHGDDPAPLDSTTSVFASPWFWTVVGAVIVAAGVTAGFFLLSDSPTEGDFGGRWEI